MNTDDSDLKSTSSLYISKMIRFLFLLLVFSFLNSCGNTKKTQLIDAFDSLYSGIINEQYDEVYTSLTPESQQYIQNLYQARKEGFNAVFDLGHEARLPYITALAAAKIGDTSTLEKDFFKYLCLQDISIFSCYNTYQYVESKTTFNPTPFVAIYKDSEHGKSLSYLRWVEQNDGSFLLDLIYTLQQEEKLQKSLYADDLQSLSKGNVVAQIERLYKSNFVKELNDFDYHNLVKERKSSLN